MSLEENEFMQRALDLALLGIGKVYPNPMVGCVIVKDKKIIGEGWHREFGAPHAEVNAIHSVQNKELLRGAEMYVTLEPCSHFGKTPPCADFIIQYPFKKIFICNIDTFGLVNGQGILKLQQAGIAVESGILKDKGRFLNRRFFTNVEQKRPYIILKWAETSDGFIAKKDYSSKWITGQLSRKLVHKWRSEEHAILVGKSTAHYDNPLLNVRDWKGENPVRIVLDSNLLLSKKLNVFNGDIKTIVFNLIQTAQEGNLQYIIVDGPMMLVKDFLDHLQRKNICSVIVEGGQKTLQSFIDCGLWDEARIFTSPIEFGNGIQAPHFISKFTESIKIEDDLLKVYYNF